MPSTALYRRIADDLRDAIRAGTYPPGAQLPTEPELQERYECSRNTIRLAIRELTAEGLVTTARRRGTLVRQPVLLEHRAVSVERPDRMGESDSWFSQVSRAGRTPSQDFSMRIEPASQQVARRLNLTQDALVCVRDCMRYVDGTPWSEQVSYYPMDVAERAGLLTPHDIEQGTVRAMAAVGLIEVGHVDELTARMPSPEEARQFDLPVGVPVMIYVRTAYTSERAIRVTRELHPADRHVLIYELGDLSAPGVSGAA